MTELVAECFGEEWEEDGTFPDIEVMVEEDEIGVEVKSQR